MNKKNEISEVSKVSKAETRPTASKPLYHQDHPRPKTRRELLSQGFFSMSAMCMAPTLSTLVGGVSGTAHGRDCAGAAGQENVPFLTFDLAGGAALPANFLVGKQGGPLDLLPSYSTLGWDPRNEDLDSRFGIPMAGNSSMLLRGMLQTMSGTAISNTRMGSVCNFSQDDSGNNKLSCISLLPQAGYLGQFLKLPIGMTNSLSGGKSDSIRENPAYRPLFVDSISTLLQSVSFGEAFDNLNLSSIGSMAKALKKISRDHISRLPGTESGELLAELAGCSYEELESYTQGVSGLDPRLNNVYQNIYGINQNTSARDVNAISAGIVMNVLKGNSGPGVLSIGGCDYHDGTSSTGDVKDLEIGIQIGRAVESARLEGTKLFFQILTDGGCNSRPGTRNWQGDSGDRSMTIMGYFDPGAPREMRTNQIGHYTNGEGVERSTLLGSSPAKVAYSVYANYLNLQGRLGEFEENAPNIFSTEELESILLFA